MRIKTYIFFTCLVTGGLLGTPGAWAQDAPADTPKAAEPAISSAPPPAAPAPVSATAPVAATAPIRATEAPAAVAGNARHRGFTFELGLGASYTYVNGSTGDRYKASHFGYSPLSVSVGGFLTPTFALALRSSGAGHFPRNFKDSASTSFIGVTGQYFVSSDLFVSAGVGLGLMSKSRNWFESDSSTNYQAGLAFSGRIGYAFARSKPGKNQNTFSVFAEAIPGFYRSNTALTSIVGLQWQLN